MKLLFTPLLVALVTLLSFASSEPVLLTADKIITRTRPQGYSYERKCIQLLALFEGFYIFLNFPFNLLHFKVISKMILMIPNC